MERFMNHIHLGGERVSCFLSPRAVFHHTDTFLRLVIADEQAFVGSFRDPSSVCHLHPLYLSLSFHERKRKQVYRTLLFLWSSHSQPSPSRWSPENRHASAPRLNIHNAKNIGVKLHTAWEHGHVCTSPFTRSLSSKSKSEPCFRFPSKRVALMLWGCCVEFIC